MDNTREFSNYTKDFVLKETNFSCVICGFRTLVDCYHIHSRSLDAKRAGTNQDRWENDEYIRSIGNCVTLCDFHGKMINTPFGLRTFSVQYLKSLMEEKMRCTALIPGDDGTLVRCSEETMLFRCPQHKKSNPIDEEGKRQLEGFCSLL